MTFHSLSRRLIRLCCFAVLLISLSAAQGLPQRYTERYDPKLQRTNFYDASGRWIGYAVENTKFGRMEYYDTTGQLLKYERHDQNYPLKIANDTTVSQQGIKRWNGLYQRYDVLDSSGRQTGYYKYDKRYGRWVYTPGIY